MRYSRFFIHDYLPDFNVRDPRARPPQALPLGHVSDKEIRTIQHRDKDYHNLRYERKHALLEAKRKAGPRDVGIYFKVMFDCERVEVIARDEQYRMVYHAYAHRSQVKALQQGFVEWHRNSEFSNKPLRK